VYVEVEGYGLEQICVAELREKLGRGQKELKEHEEKKQTCYFHFLAVEDRVQLVDLVQKYYK
jgi:hypothetical protein